MSHTSLAMPRNKSISIPMMRKPRPSRHRRITLDYLGFRPFHDQARQEIVHEIRTMVRSQLRPTAIFFQVLKLLETRKTEIPSAYTLTELITHESQQHQRQLTHTSEDHLSPAHRALLDALLDKQEALWPSEPHVQRYKLTLLKRFSQCTKPAENQSQYRGPPHLAAPVSGDGGGC